MGAPRYIVAPIPCGSVLPRAIRRRPGPSGWKVRSDTWSAARLAYAQQPVRHGVDQGRIAQAGQVAAGAGQGRRPGGFGKADTGHLAPAAVAALAADARKHPLGRRTDRRSGTLQPGAETQRGHDQTAGRRRAARREPGRQVGGHEIVADFMARRRLVERPQRRRVRPARVGRGRGGKESAMGFPGARRFPLAPGRKRPAVGPQRTVSRPSTQSRISLLRQPTARGPNCTRLGNFPLFSRRHTVVRLRPGHLENFRQTKNPLGFVHNP